MDVRVASRHADLRRPAARPRSGRCASASWCSCACAIATAPSAGARPPARALRRRPARRGARRASRPTRRSCATATRSPAADLLERCRDRRRPAAGARRGRPRAVGPRRQPRGQAGQRADHRRPRRRGPRQRHDRAPRTAPARPAGRRRRERGLRCVKVKVGVGDDAGRVAAVRAAAGPEMELRLDANGAWEVDEAVAAIEALAPAGLELVEEPVHGVAAMRAGPRPRRRARRDGRDGRRARLADRDGRRRRLPEGLALRRHLAAARPGRARPRVAAPTSTSPRPSTARSGSPPRVHCAAALRPTAACGLGTLGAVRRRARPCCPVDRRRDRRPRAARARRLGLRLLDEPLAAREARADRARQRPGRRARSPMPTTSHAAKTSGKRSYGNDVPSMFL